METEIPATTAPVEDDNPDGETVEEDLEDAPEPKNDPVEE